MHARRRKGHEYEIRTVLYLLTSSKIKNSKKTKLLFMPIQY